MSQLNTYGLKIDLNSLSETSEYTEGNYADRGRVDIFCNRRTGAVWGIFNLQDHWQEYRNNPEIIPVGHTDRKISQQTILDMINDKISYLKYVADQIGEEYTDIFS